MTREPSAATAMLMAAVAAVAARATGSAQAATGSVQVARDWRAAARRALIAAPLFAALLVTGCASTSGSRELHGDGLGSTWKVKLAEPPANLDWPTVQRGIQQQINEVSEQISRWNPASSLSALNAATDSDWHPVPNELRDALDYALALASNTGGAYDPTVAPLVDVWGFGTEGRRFSPPSAEDVSAARKRVGWSQVQLDTINSRVRRPAGVQIDLSSMQHGFAADQVAIYLQSLGITRYLVDVGSELRAAGNTPEGHPWRVAIERPPWEPQPNGPAGPPSDVIPLHIVALGNAGVATSGNYRYFFDYNGRRYSHRIDPRTAEPITHPLASVTVIDPLCMRADALATALTVLGPVEGLDYARRHDIAALFIVRTAQGIEEHMTPAFESHIER